MRYQSFSWTILILQMFQHPADFDVARRRGSEVRDHRETLSKLCNSAMAPRIGEHGRIIAFRNILIRGYAKIFARLVWHFVQNKPPVMRREVDELLASV